MSPVGEGAQPQIVLPQGRGVVHRTCDPATHYIHEGVPVAFPDKPGSWARWDWAAKAWIDPRTQADHEAEVAAAWAGLRAERDARLRACDWTQSPDVPITAERRAAWAAYRQALRDMTDTTADPAAPAWPDPPNL
ncbi:hypothetical protein ERN12_05905 [Rhodobacteraceae bacterium]|nr:hypothetical protein ERN12_05905 [Paracoccaceae bacterium]